MPAIVFPNSPSVGATVEVGTVTYTWDGTKWKSAPTTSINSTNNWTVTEESNNLVFRYNNVIAAILTQSGAFSVTGDIAANAPI